MSPMGTHLGIIGDWGNGMDDAAALLSDLVRREPDVIIHLGDIYYAGTDHQVQEAFLRIFDDVFQALRPGRPRIPVFNMAGNHDYGAGEGAATGRQLLPDSLLGRMRMKIPCRLWPTRSLPRRAFLFIGSNETQGFQSALALGEGVHVTGIATGWGSQKQPNEATH